MNAVEDRHEKLPALVLPSRLRLESNEGVRLSIFPCYCLRCCLHHLPPFLRFHNAHSTCVLCPHPPSVSKLLADRDKARIRYPIDSPFHWQKSGSACFLVCWGGTHPIPHQLPSTVSTNSSCWAGMLHSATSSSTSAVLTQTGLSVHYLTQIPFDTLTSRH
ncbi:hypothetical protein PAXRUDRAFT_688428 [Paxillus rubicundulus Ve08.2h10]|uniref:Uncharacterized protein n=1 Tax=Paxillus rubicundulus Ve08.2h10 TaxID=930991 RepID=A0A0D0DNT8_9AGAM|nr:hypothetical protein PAXRUDRAFT_688428 [Paxillus rubicundulus Ve08.2h10]